MPRVFNNRKYRSHAASDATTAAPGIVQQALARIIATDSSGNYLKSVLQQRRIDVSTLQYDNLWTVSGDCVLRRREMNMVLNLDQEPAGGWRYKLLIGSEAPVVRTKGAVIRIIDAWRT